MSSEKFVPSLKVFKMSKNKLNLTLPPGSIEPVPAVSPSPPVPPLPTYSEPSVIPE